MHTMYSVLANASSHSLVLYSVCCIWIYANCCYGFCRIAVCWMFSYCSSAHTTTQFTTAIIPKSALLLFGIAIVC